MKSSVYQRAASMRCGSWLRPPRRQRLAPAGLFFGGHRLSVIMYMAVPTATWEVAMKFLQDRRILWGGAVIIVLIVLAMAYG